MFSFWQLLSTDKNFLDALWGKLASEILMQNWETALDDLTKLKEIIDGNVSTMISRAGGFINVIRHQKS